MYLSEQFSIPSMIIAICLLEVVYNYNNSGNNAGMTEVCVEVA